MAMMAREVIRDRLRREVGLSRQSGLYYRVLKLKGYARIQNQTQGSFIPPPKQTEGHTPNEVFWGI